MRVLALAAAAALILVGPALADGPIATTPATGPAAPQPTTTPAPLPAPASQADLADAQVVAMGPCGPEKVKPDGSLDTAPHGEVEAGVGTNGYRQLAGSVCQPIGKDGFVAVSASQTQGGGRRR